eukprot:GHVU01196954.1.p1 GENE.GHVU01196954.1~~GHVU01196954.1.p1  ORF type:complete len:123 (+),score=9.22 GHVU01196954.1:627-995(+)
MGTVCGLKRVVDYNRSDDVLLSLLAGWLQIAKRWNPSYRTPRRITQMAVSTMLLGLEVPAELTIAVFAAGIGYRDGLLLRHPGGRMFLVWFGIDAQHMGSDVCLSRCPALLFSARSSPHSNH